MFQRNQVPGTNTNGINSTRGNMLNRPSGSSNDRGKFTSSSSQASGFSSSKYAVIQGNRSKSGKIANAVVAPTPVFAPSLKSTDMNKSKEVVATNIPANATNTTNTHSSQAKEETVPVPTKSSVWGKPAQESQQTNSNLEPSTTSNVNSKPASNMNWADYDSDDEKMKEYDPKNSAPVEMNREEYHPQSNYYDDRYRQRSRSGSGSGNHFQQTNSNPYFERRFPPEQSGDYRHQRSNFVRDQDNLRMQQPRQPVNKYNTPASYSGRFENRQPEHDRLPFDDLEEARYEREMLEKKKLQQQQQQHAERMKQEQEREHHMSEQHTDLDNSFNHDLDYGDIYEKQVVEEEFLHHNENIAARHHHTNFNDHHSRFTVPSHGQNQFARRFPPHQGMDMARRHEEDSWERNKNIPNVPRMTSRIPSVAANDYQMLQANDSKKSYASLFPKSEHENLTHSQMEEKPRKMLYDHRTNRMIDAADSNELLPKQHSHNIRNRPKALSGTSNEIEVENTATIPVQHESVPAPQLPVAVEEAPSHVIDYGVPNITICGKKPRTNGVLFRFVYKGTQDFVESVVDEDMWKYDIVQVLIDENNKIDSTTEKLADIQVESSVSSKKNEESNAAGTWRNAVSDKNRTTSTKKNSSWASKSEDSESISIQAVVAAAEADQLSRGSFQTFLPGIGLKSTSVDIGMEAMQTHIESMLMLSAVEADFTVTNENKVVTDSESAPVTNESDRSNFQQNESLRVSGRGGRGRGGRGYAGRGERNQEEGGRGRGRGRGGRGPRNEDALEDGYGRGGRGEGGRGRNRPTTYGPPAERKQWSRTASNEVIRE